ncbi:MAG: hypothetical protein AB9872_07945 [Solidesulfovibrio sp.]
MPLFLKRLAVCLLVAVLCGATLAQAETRQVFAHLLVVPTELPDGGNILEKTAAFEAWLTEAFGGFTRLGPGGGGWKNEKGQVETEANATYLTTASRDFSKEIATRLFEDFSVRVPYVLVFPAGLYAK